MEFKGTRKKFEQLADGNGLVNCPNSDIQRGIGMWNVVDILIIEDNVELATILSDFLLDEGYSVFVASSGEEGLHYLAENPVKLLLLDIMLPELDGFAVCRITREKHNLPIIIMSARHGDDNKIIGLELGADDYLEKPFSVNLLIAKVKSHLRRSYHMFDNKQLLSEGDITINTASMKVYLKDELGCDDIQGI